MPLEVLPVEPQPHKRTFEDAGYGADDFSVHRNLRGEPYFAVNAEFADVSIEAPHSPGDTREASGERQVCVSVVGRKVDSITDDEAVAAGVLAMPNVEVQYPDWPDLDDRNESIDRAGTHYLMARFQANWEATHPAYPWGSWAWFVKWEAVKEESDASNHPAADTV